MERERVRGPEARPTFESHYENMRKSQEEVLEEDKKQWDKAVTKASTLKMAYSAKRGARVAMMTGMFAEVKSKPLDGRVAQILPGSHTSTHKHSYETMMFITEGMGYSIVGGNRHNWAERDCLYIPPNVWHQHWNRDAEKPAGYLSITDAPLVQCLRRLEMEDIGDAPEHPEEQAEETYYEQELAEAQEILNDRADTPIIRKWRTVNLTLNERGAKSSYIIDPNMFKTGGIDMAMNMLPPGGYMMSHRHGGGALIYIVEGKGYTLIDGVKHEWEKGDLIWISHWCWHQHFNRDLENPAVYVRNSEAVWALRNLMAPLVGAAAEHGNDGPDPLGIVWPEEGEHAHDHPGGAD